MFDDFPDLPCSPPTCPPRSIQVHEISLDQATHRGRCRLWQETIQPHIAKDRNRADRDWRWGRIIPVLTAFGGARRRARLFQMTVGPDEQPAAMISILEHERWPANHALKASFLWFLSTAPSHLLCRSGPNASKCVPKGVGTAAFHIAVRVALSGAADGRLWLHADPAGGEALSKWYAGLNMDVIDPARFPTLPGYDTSLRHRQNDGRYFWLDTDASRQLHSEYLSSMGQV